MRERRKAPAGCYWRGDTLWARFTVDGAEIRRSLSTGDGRVAASRLAKLRAEEIAARKFGEIRPTWEQAVVSWTTAVKGHTKAGTSARYAVSLRQMEPMLLGRFVDQVDRKLVSAIVAKRQEDGLTNATIRRDLTALSSVLSHCEDQGWREDNPALARLRKLKERRDPIVLPEPDQIEAVIAKAPGNFKALIRAAWLTGCRLDELRTLTWEQVDLKRGKVSLYKTKNGKPRVIEVGGARSLLESLPRSSSTDAVFWHERFGEGSHYLNVSSNFRRLVASAQKAAQAGTGTKGAAPAFRPFRFHDLRHRFAVDWLRQGRGIYDLSKHLGHSSVKVTEIYLDYLTADEAGKVR